MQMPTNLSVGQFEGKKKKSQVDKVVSGTFPDSLFSGLLALGLKGRPWLDISTMV